MTYAGSRLRQWIPVESYAHSWRSEPSTVAGGWILLQAVFAAKEQPPATAGGFETDELPLLLPETLAIFD